MAGMPYYQPNNPYMGYQNNSYPSMNNYGYGNYPQNSMIQSSPTIQQNQQIAQTPTLYGKIVDGIDTVRVQEIPIGNYGIYPKGDGTSIFVKSWNADGSTRIDEYQRIISQETDTNQATSPDILSDKIDEIYSSIKDINKKIDELKPSTTSTTTSNRGRKKEVDTDGE